MTVALVLLSGALWLSSRPRRSKTPASAGQHRTWAAGRSAGRRSSGPALPFIASAATVLVCVVVAGVAAGAVAGAVLAPAAALLVHRCRSGDPIGISASDRSWLPLTLDLAAAALLAGQPLSVALAAAAPRTRPALAAEFEQVAGMLRLGAEPADAWQVFALDQQLRPIAELAIRGAASGIKLAAGFTELASELRAGARANAQARAQRVGVWAIAPLGLCFLPAFVCIGIAPVIIGVAKGLLQSTLF